MNALFSAILDDDEELVTKLLKADPGVAVQRVQQPKLYQSKIYHWLYTGDTPLHLAAAGYRDGIAQILLKAGADPNAADNHRWSTPLHYAADGYIVGPVWDSERQVKMLRVLLKAGADIRAADKNGATALHRSVRTRCAAAVKFLLDSGADPTLKNTPGSTPFHLAVRNTGHGGSGSKKARTAQDEIVRTFLEHGVSPNLKDAKGKSVLDWATSDRIQQLLASNRG